MNIKICDICHRPIVFDNELRIRLKWFSRLDGKWVELDTHRECWHALCDSVKRCKEQELNIGDMAEYGE